MSLFSVIIPAYNAGQTIARAVHSCFLQTLPPHEVIVVDDGSTDDTIATLATFGNRVLVYKHVENRGPSAARNLGLTHASGKLIAYLDADDVWHPEKLQRCAEAMKSRSNVTLLYHWRTVAAFPKTLPAANNIQLQSWRALLLSNPVATPCAVHPRANGLRWNEDMRHMEDHDFFLRCAEQGCVIFLPLALTRLGRPLLSEGGLSANRGAMRRGERQVLRRVADRHIWVRMALPVLLLVSRLKQLVRPFRSVR